MTLQEIADFLNIPESTVRYLAEHRLLPGSPSSEGWEIILADLESWYVRFSGSEWANLVADGKMDLISIEIELGADVPSDRLENVLEQWNNTGIVNIIKRSTERNGSTTVAFTLSENYERARRALESLKSLEEREIEEQAKAQGGRIPKSVRDLLSVSFRCELVLGAQTIIASLSPGGLLRLNTQENLGELPQRDREIIRFYLSSYAQRIAQQIRHK